MDFRKLDLKLGFAYSVVILTLLATGFIAVNAAVANLQPETYDPFWQPKVIAVQAFFANATTIIFVAWITNVTGLTIIYAKMKAEEYTQITYNAWKFYGTLGMILGVGITAFTTLPAPWNQLALALASISKIIETSFTQILPPVQTAPQSVKGPPATA
jgi:hypothetical protein